MIAQIIRFLKKNKYGKDVHVMPTAKIINLSHDRNNIQIGKNTYIRGELTVYPHAGKIKIGEYCYVGENTRIWSGASITIGNNVLISHNVDIHDCNDHPLNPIDRHEHYKKIITIGHPQKMVGLNEKPIVIKDNAWIGFDSIILKGVTIGEGAIVAAGSVVTKDVKPYTVVAGNPAKFVKMIEI